MYINDGGTVYNLPEINVYCLRMYLKIKFQVFCVR